MYTLRDVPRGGELFVDYGEDWFKSRTREVGAVPFVRDFERVDRLLKKFRVRAASGVRRGAMCLGGRLPGILQSVVLAGTSGGAR
jgi:hypothetical protein